MMDSVFTWCFLAVFAMSFGGLLVEFVIYPPVMRFLARTRMIPWRFDDAYLPSVTMVVAAHNEEEVIEAKIRNFLAIDYPPDRLFLWIGSDGSTDGTNEILSRLADGTRIRYITTERLGKPQVINEVMRRVNSEATVYSDANTMYHPYSIRKMVRHFADASIGGVCGHLMMIPVEGSIAGESEIRYWSMENKLKNWEGRFQSTLGATGGIYAIRTRLFVDHPDTLAADDLLLPMRIVAQGYRCVFEPEALAEEGSALDVRTEFQRKIRVANTSMRVVPFLRPVFHRFPPRVRWMFRFHKYLRWVSPVFLALLFLSAAALWAIPLVFYGVILPLACLLVFVALGWVAERQSKGIGALAMPYYFFATNAAIFLAYFKVFSSNSRGTWDRLPRSESRYHESS
jgi:cellulose synthase/poly-beta-1,6-N-acetylglucosamine synthase-like glycosyltransferase